MEPLRKLAQEWWSEGLDKDDDTLLRCAAKLWDAIGDAETGIARFLTGDPVAVMVKQS